MTDQEIVEKAAALIASSMDGDVSVCLVRQFLTGSSMLASIEEDHGRISGALAHLDRDSRVILATALGGNIFRAIAAAAANPRWAAYVDAEMRSWITSGPPYDTPYSFKQWAELLREIPSIYYPLPEDNDGQR